MDWKIKTYNIVELSTLAFYSAATTAMGFLYEQDIIPDDVIWKRGNSIPRTNISGAAIPAGYLAEVAFSWDKNGPSDPLEFTDALRAEIAGTETNGIIAETLGELGRRG